MQQPNTIYEREKAIFRYVQALERGDMEGVAAVLEAASLDPELERIITEINLAYIEEEQLTPIVTDAQIVRDLLRQHLHSAFENREEEKNVENLVFEEENAVDDAMLPTSASVEDKPLTVGDVAKRLQESNRVPLSERDTLHKLLSSSLPLPASLSIQAVRQLATELKIKASERFLDIFRDTAIMLGIGRSQNKAQLAAAREQRSRYTTRPNKRPQDSKSVKKIIEPKEER